MVDSSVPFMYKFVVDPLLVIAKYVQTPVEIVDVLIKVLFTDGYW